MLNRLIPCKMEKLKEISSVFSEEYLNDRLSEWFERDVIFTDAKFLDGATGKGDSYLSNVYRITMCGKIKSPKPNEDSNVSVRILLKCFPKNIAIRKTLRSHTFFRNEINFYNEVLPELLKFQAGKKMKDPFTNVPKLFAAATNGIDDIIAMEDLSYLNYSMPVRQEHIDANHINIILETFAKFHALSFAFRDQHPEKYERLTKYISEEYYDPKYWNWYKGFWKHLCNISLDAIHKEYPDTIYEERVKLFAQDETYNKMIEAVAVKRGTEVVSHGDSWTPNFLFQYENDTPVRSMMIDFQLMRSASPILDLSFFIYACGSDKHYLKNNYDKILKHYYDKLSEQIKDLGSDSDKVYPWEIFMKEVQELSYFGVGFAMESTPVIVLEPDEAMDTDELSGTEGVQLHELWKLQPIKSKKGRQRLCDIFVHAVDRGFI